ncbi:infection structure specific protein [Apiospora rasikravindrae]|uniref:Infection structure specific protein n=1 Tax=Apiospora rasikravindrae TaxID=990691 RepID=A0ABR1TW98_9PEZI
MHAPSVLSAAFFALAVAGQSDDNSDNGPVVIVTDVWIMPESTTKPKPKPTPTPSPSPVPAVAHREQPLDAKCTKALNDVIPVYKLVPTPPPALAGVPLPTDPCETPTFNGTLSAQYASYTSQVGDWYKSHSSEILGALSKCPALMEMASDVPFCKTTSTSTTSTVPKPTPTPTQAKPTAAATTTKPPTAPAGGSDKGDTDNNAFNAASAPPSTPSDKPESSDAHRYTSGVIGMAIAAASFLGAVVAM